MRGKTMEPGQSLELQRERLESYFDGLEVELAQLAREIDEVSEHDRHPFREALEDLDRRAASLREDVLPAVEINAQKLRARVVAATEMMDRLEEDMRGIRSRLHEPERFP
jgi:hypothetical protein